MLEFVTKVEVYRVPPPPPTKFIKSVGEECQDEKRGREYHGCGEKYTVEKGKSGEEYPVLGNFIHPLTKVLKPLIAVTFVIAFWIVGLLHWQAQIEAFLIFFQKKESLNRTTIFALLLKTFLASSDRFCSGQSIKTGGGWGKGLSTKEKI